MIFIGITCFIIFMHFKITKIKHANSVLYYAQYKLINNKTIKHILQR